MDFMLHANEKSRVLMVTFGTVVTDDRFLAGFAAVKDYLGQHGPHHGIADFSQVERFDMSNEMLSQIAAMAPAFPVGMRRIVVAPTPAAYVATRIVQALRSGSSAPIEIAATTDGALQLLAADSGDFTAV